MFGLGYIGYMTFIVTLLREQGVGGGVVVAFYVLLGVGVIASSWLWARLLQRYRGGAPLALLNALLARGHAAAGAERASGRGVRLGGAVRRGVPVGGGLDHRAGAPQPAARRPGRRASRRSRSSSRPGRSSGRAWSAGWPTVRAAWRAAWRCSAGGCWRSGALLAARQRAAALSPASAAEEAAQPLEFGLESRAERRLARRAAG